MLLANALILIILYYLHTLIFDLITYFLCFFAYQILIFFFESNITPNKLFYSFHTTLTSWQTGLYSSNYTYSSTTAFLCSSYICNLIYSSLLIHSHVSYTFLYISRMINIYLFYSSTLQLYKYVSYKITIFFYNNFLLYAYPE